MGTFHPHAHALHGMTVVVETNGAKVYVGRCDTVDGDGVVLMGADVHEEGPGRPSRAEYLANAARWGVHERLRHVRVPAADVRSVRRLGE
jgi:hypothetical protein